MASPNLKMSHTEETSGPAVPYCQGVINRGAHFAGSFATAQRDTSSESVLPIPREKVTAQNLLKPLTEQWTDRSIWASALIEGVGTMSLSYMSSILHSTFVNFDTIYTPAWVGTTNIFLLTLFIHACAPASGGHLNPLITFATMMTGLTGFSRAVLYMIAQTVGATAAGGLFRASFGEEAITKYHGGGCYIERDSFAPGNAFIVEMICSFILLFLAFGNALDPRQGKLSGPILAPVLVGSSLGLVSFASAGLAPGYTGAGLNPARCFSMAVGRGNFTDQWIWWFGPCAGAILAAIVYRSVPPYHAAK